MQGIGAIGCFGKDRHALLQCLLNGKSVLQSVSWQGREVPAGILPEAVLNILNTVGNRHSDRSVQLGILAAREACAAHQMLPEYRTGISMGTSRGPTRNWEKAHARYLESLALSPFTSPLTTPGVLASSVAEDLSLRGPEITLSMTCASSLVGLINGLAWLNCGWTDYFIAGGAEASLTDFTLSQAKALNLISQDSDSPWPCRPLDPEKNHNTMVLSEAAACLLLASQPGKNTDPMITGLGCAREETASPTGINDKGIAYQSAIKQALNISPGDVDLILVHAPGTLSGDAAELFAIQSIFQNQAQAPVLYPLKALIGHTYGASGALALVAACLLLEHEVPLPEYLSAQGNSTGRPKRIMVNSAGFGAQAVTVILEKQSI